MCSVYCGFVDIDVSPMAQRLLIFFAGYRGGGDVGVWLWLRACGCGDGCGAAPVVGNFVRVASCGACTHTDD